MAEKPNDTDLSKVSGGQNWWGGGCQYYIDSSDCVDCGLCISDCPVEAIYEVD